VKNLEPLLSHEHWHHFSKLPILSNLILQIEGLVLGLKIPTIELKNYHAVRSCRKMPRFLFDIPNPLACVYIALPLRLSRTK
jgi:hypothetical protein